MKNGLILGFFDGVHIAHQSVILSTVKYAGNPILITFKHSPAKFFNKKCEYILSREKSIEKIKSLGVKQIVELDFSKIVNLDAEEYIDFLVKKYSPVCISSGFNHTFGRNKSGNANLLSKLSEKYGYKYFCVQKQMFEENIISSTLIKNYLQSGEIEKANYLLGSNFELFGEVKHGAKLGRTIGFPTANIDYPEDIVKIPYGVYAGKVDNNPAVINWGMKPTINNVKCPIAEAHIINYKGDLYGQKIKIEILKKIRDEKIFSNIEELKIQIEKDVDECLKLSL